MAVSPGRDEAGDLEQSASLERVPDDPAQSDDDLDVAVAELLDDLPEGAVKREIRRSIRMHHGPMPDAATLAAYREVDPRILDEVIEGARDNRLHRYSMDKKLVNSSRLSLVLCAIIVAIGLACALILGLQGHPFLAALFGAGGLSPVIIAMVRGGGDWRGRGRRD